MNNEERENKITKLKIRLDSINDKLRKGYNVSLKIERDRLRREIRDLQQTMTDEDWQSFMSERSEIDIRKC